MEKYDIAQNDLCVQKILAVIKNRISRKRLAVNGRHSDAFVYVISGSCEYRFDDGVEFTAKEGDVFYLPFRSVYTMHIGEEDYRFIFCDFKFFEEPTSPRLFSSEHLKNAEPFFVKLLNLYRSASRNKQTECMSVLYGIYNVLQKSLVAQEHTGSQNDVIAEAKRYMEESFGDPELTIQRISDRAGISEVYFRKLFREQNGVPPIKYLNALRLKNAKELMRYPFLSLEECAKMSGFSTLQYFCRLFKKEFNVSPGIFRKGLE